MNYARKRFHSGAHSFALIVVLLVMTVLAACDVRPPHARTVAVRDETILQDLYRKGSTLSPVCVDANSERRLLAVGGSVGMNGAIRIWDVDTAELVLRIDNLPPYVRDIDFSPDGNRLAAATGTFKRPGIILVLDAMSGTTEHKLDGHSGFVNAVSFSRDGTTIVSCGTFGLENEVDGGQLRRWDLEKQTSEVLWQDQLTTLTCVDFSPNGLLFAVGGGISLYGAAEQDAGIIQFWDGTTFQHRATRVAHLANLESLAFSPDGKTLISGGGRSYFVPEGSPHFTLKFWNADKATLIDSISIDSWWKRPKMVVRFNDIGISPNGNLVAIAMGSWNRGGKWGELRIWNRAAGALEETILFPCHALPIEGAAFVGDNETLGAISDDGKIAVWYLESTQERVGTGHRSEGENDDGRDEENGN